MTKILNVRLSRHWHWAAVLTFLGCSQQIHLEKNKVPTADSQDIGERSRENQISDPFQEPKETGLSLTGAVTVVPMATSSTVDNGNLALINIHYLDRVKNKEWYTPVGTGLYSAGGVITAAHVLDSLQVKLRSLNRQGFWARPVIRLPKLPGYSDVFFPAVRGVTPLRITCNSQAVAPWNDIGILTIMYPQGVRNIEAKLSELAGLPTNVNRVPRISYSPVLSSGVIPRFVSYYGRKNNNTQNNTDLMYKSESYSRIMSSACADGGGPCYFVYSGSQGDHGDSGGPLWMPGNGWIGIIVKKGPRPQQMVNLEIACGSTGSVTFDSTQQTTYFAKFSANSAFMQRIFTNMNNNDFWIAVVNNVYPDLVGYLLRSSVPYGTGATPASIESGAPIPIKNIKEGTISL